MRNYFKGMVGRDARFFFFDDAVPDDMRAALAQARDATGKDGVVSVWERADTIPSSILRVGEVPERKPGESLEEFRARVGASQ